jgi:hypothetical protein
MELHAPVPCEPLHDRRNGEAGVIGPLGSQKRDHSRRALHRPDRPWSSVPETREAASRKPISQDIKRLPTVAERRPDGRDRLLVDEMRAQHLILHLQLIAGIEERRMLPKQGGPNTGSLGVKRPFLFKPAALVRAASRHGCGPPWDPASHSTCICVN